MSFEFLEQPCAVVGPITLESNGQAVPYARVETEPWVRFHDTSAVDPERGSLGYRVTYEVRLAASDVSVPIVLPATVLTSNTRRGESIASISVGLPSEGRVILPRMTRDRTTGFWSARMVALPSAVRITGARAPNEKCRTGGAIGDGGLARIFWALVATLALWVSLYLWWANRQRQQA